MTHPIWPWSLDLTVRLMPSLDSPYRSPKRADPLWTHISWAVTALTLITGKLIGFRPIFGLAPLTCGFALYHWADALWPNGSTPNGSRASPLPLLSGFALTLLAWRAGVRLFRNHLLERLCKYRDHSFQIKSARALSELPKCKSPRDSDCYVKVSSDFNQVKNVQMSKFKIS